MVALQFERLRSSYSMRLGLPGASVSCATASAADGCGGAADEEAKDAALCAFGSAAVASLSGRGALQLAFRKGVGCRWSPRFT